MAIIKYSFVNGEHGNRRPLGLSDHGYFHHLVDDTWIGVGSGVGTELTVAQLKTYVKDVRDNDPAMAYEENPPLAPGSGTHVWRDYTDAEIDTMVDDWCSARGIS